MPELPEVHTITTDLKKTIIGFVIAQSWVAAGYYKIKDQAQFTKQLQGQKVVDVRRVAKNILIELASGDFIHIHLAMTGQVFIIDPKEKKNKKAHVVMHLKNDQTSKIMTFSDVRTFGKIEILTPAQIATLENKYGVEPIAPDIDIQKLYDALKAKKTIIKNILMDQSLVAGLGNIYATEALYLAKIHPKTKMHKLDLVQFTNLIEAAQQVLREGIKNRGSTLPDKMYVDIWGNAGSQQNHFNVYLQPKCKNCGTAIAYEKIAGRGTYYCPTCQL